MREQPTFPAYRQVTPPVSKRWLTAGATVLLLFGGISALIRPPNVSFGQLAALAMLVIVLGVVFWSIRILLYRLAVHNSQLYSNEVKQLQQQWWLKHRQSIALNQAVLVGPAGTTLSQWQRLINRDHRPPEARPEIGGNALRLMQTFTVDIAEREKHLVKTLVLQWREQHPEKLAIAPLHCYWMGTEQAWAVFLEEMAKSFPEVLMPPLPEAWNGEESMGKIIDELAHSPEEAWIICAGCLSNPSAYENRLPAGEAAVLWLFGPNGKVQFSRGEVYNPSPSENITAVTHRALEQSEVTQPPDACFLFSQPDITELTDSGWNVTQHIQDLNWGELAGMESMVVQTLAAFFAEHHAIPCGWLARDPNHTLALGIVKPYGSGK